MGASFAELLAREARDRIARQKEREEKLREACADPQRLARLAAMLENPGEALKSFR